MKLTKEELKQMDQRTRKLINIHKVLHPSDNFDSSYVSWKEGGRNLARIEDSFDASIKRFVDYIEKFGGRPIAATRKHTDNTIINRTNVARNKNTEKNSTMDSSSDKHVTSHARKLVPC